MRTKIETFYANLLKETGMVTAEILKNEITRVADIPVALLKTGEEEQERLRIRSEVINSTSSYRQSRSSQAYLHEYLLSLNRRDIAFEDITEDFGWDYKLYLKAKGCGAGHINHCLTWLNRLIYIAVDREVIRFNPLFGCTLMEKEARLQAKTHKQSRTATDYGTAHAGKVAGTYTKGVHHFS